MNARVRLGLVLIAILLAAGLLAPVLAPHDPNAQPAPAALKNQPPSPAHPLGTDFISRDVLSRVLYGTRISLAVASLSVLISMTVGSMVGLVAGYQGGLVDMVLMRFVDAGLAIPRILFVLVVVALWPTLGIPTLVLMLGLTSWFGTSRLVRAEVLSIKTRDYITACRASGMSKTRTMLRHVLPNVMAPILVAGTLGVGSMILIEAGLAFLGHGIPEPHASLGKMIRDAEPLFAPWTVIAPGAVIVLTVLAFSILSDGLREATDRRAVPR